MDNLMVTIIILHYKWTNIIFDDFSAKSKRVAVKLVIRLVTQFVQKYKFLNQIFFVYQKYLKQTFKNKFLSTKSPIEIEFSRCEFTKVILLSKSRCEMFVLKLSDK